MEQSISIQSKVIKKEDMPASAQTIADNLLEIHSGIEAFVIVKNMIATLDHVCDLMKEKAIASCPSEKDAVVLGAKVATKNLPKKYDYDGTHYKSLKESLEIAKESLKKHEKVLQNTDWINPLTGETETAKLVEQEITRTLTITF